MKLAKHLLKSFAEQVSVQNEKDAPTTCYATVVSKNENQAVVNFDGSSINTPVDCAMDAEPGDRVMVQIINHKAVVVGNTTSPASARTASAFMKLLNSGLVIGNIESTDSGNYYLYLVSSGNYAIMEKTSTEIDVVNDIPIAEFATDHINLLGDDGGNSAFFIYTEDGVTKISGDQPLSFENRMDARHPNYIRLRSGSSGIEIGGYGRVYFNSDSNENPYSNGVELVNRNDVFPLYVCNSISANRVTIASDGFATITSPAINVPNNYMLMGIRAITHDHTKVCHLTQWGVNSDTNKCWATFHNTGSSSQNINVTFYYFCIRSS